MLTLVGLPAAALGKWDSIHRRNALAQLNDARRHARIYEYMLTCIIYVFEFAFHSENVPVIAPSNGMRCVLLRLPYHHIWHSHSWVHSNGINLSINWTTRCGRIGAEEQRSWAILSRCTLLANLAHTNTHTHKRTQTRYHRWWCAERSSCSTHMQTISICITYRAHEYTYSEHKTYTFPIVIRLNGHECFHCSFVRARACSCACDVCQL